MAHLLHDFHVNVPVDAFDTVIKDPRIWPTFWVGMDGSPRVFGDGSPGTKAEFFQHMMGMKLRMVDRTVEERHNPDGSTDWRWQFEGRSRRHLVSPRAERRRHRRPRRSTTTCRSSSAAAPSTGSPRERYAPRLRREHGQPQAARRDQRRPGGDRDGLIPTPRPGPPPPNGRRHTRVYTRGIAVRELMIGGTMRRHWRLLTLLTILAFAALPAAGAGAALRQRALAAPGPPGVGTQSLRSGRCRSRSTIDGRRVRRRQPAGRRG